MQVLISGNSIHISLTEEDDRILCTLPDGYSYETILITGFVNINYINPQCKAQQGVTYRFPPVMSKSPSTFTLLKSNATATASLVISISKFGQIPDSHYFDRAFEPILVTGDDGNEYKVIPSDQFK